MTERRDQNKSNTGRASKRSGSSKQATNEASADAERKTQASTAPADTKAGEPSERAGANESATQTTTPTANSKRPAASSGAGSGSGGSGTPPARADKEGDNNGRGLAIAALVIAVVVALGVVVAGWLAWQRVQAMGLQRPALVTEVALSRATEELGSRIEALQNDSSSRAEKLGGLQESVQTLRGAQKEMRGQVSKVTKLEGALSEVRDSISRLKKSQQQVSAQMKELGSKQRGEWKRSEAAYLARVATHRLQYYHDLPSAVAALRDAQALLKGLGGDAGAARDGVARALNKLTNAQAAPDRGKIAQQLAALEQRVGKLPLSPDAPRLIAKQGGGKGAQAEGETWSATVKNAWNQLSNGLSELVVVSRDAKVQPLRSPEQTFFLEQNIRLKLETARAAALRGEQAVYKQSLTRVREWLNKYVEADDKVVKEMKNQLGALINKQVAAKLPDVSSSLEAVRGYQ